MGDRKFPFPDFESAQKELSLDYCYNKIPPGDREKIARMAWDRGGGAAETIYKRYEGEADFFVIAEKSGLLCQWMDVDYIAGDRRYFSDYLSGKNLIRLFTKSITLWAENNNLDEKNAANLIVSHEYFHFLECTELGLTSRLYQVPMIILGALKIGKTGIRALSEIGAHGFAYTYNTFIREKKP
jgi:hypothetical protein